MFNVEVMEPDIAAVKSPMMSLIMDHIENFSFYRLWDNNSWCDARRGIIQQLVLYHEVDSVGDVGWIIASLGLLFYL